MRCWIGYTFKNKHGINGAWVQNCDDMSDVFVLSFEELNLFKYFIEYHYFIIRARGIYKRFSLSEKGMCYDGEWVTDADSFKPRGWLPVLDCYVGQFQTYDKYWYAFFREGDLKCVGAYSNHYKCMVNAECASFVLRAADLIKELV